jgi:hypothetical protein
MSIQFPFPLFQEDGIKFELEASRRSAIPDGIPGFHAVLGAYTTADGERRALMFNEVSESLFGMAIAKCYAFAEKISAEMDAPGMYELSINGPGKASRNNFHLHVRVLYLSIEQLAASVTAEAPYGYEFVRTVDKKGFLRALPKPESTEQTQPPPPAAPATPG